MMAQSENMQLSAGIKIYFFANNVINITLTAWQTHRFHFRKYN